MLIFHYRAEIWGLENAAQLESIQLGYFKRLYGLHRMTHTQFLKGDFGLWSLKSYRTVQMIKFWLRVVQLPSDRLLKAEYDELLQLHRIRSWPFKVKEVLDKTGFSFTWNDGLGPTSQQLQMDKEIKRVLEDQTVQKWAIQFLVELKDPNIVMDSKYEVGSLAADATSNTDDENKDKTPFKMPIMIGKKHVIAKPLKQTSVNPDTVLNEEEVPNKEVTTVSEININTIAPSKAGEEKPLAFPYEEPEWGGLPFESYSLEVLKEGVIVEKVDLSGKPFHVVGRSDTCDIPMQHLSVSRFHCIIQYCANEIPGMEKGMYLYDMGSRHGTLLHGRKVIPKKYQPLKVGHIFKVGGSKRMFILNGPHDDEEPESQLSVTELKLLKMQKLEEKKKEEELAKAKEEMRLAEEKKQLEEGISWGMPEEAEEATDLAENPYAVNEELNLEDPKKTLRGWFEREGYELEYDVNEKAPGHYVCRVTLPVDNNEGRQLVAEASHKGKKKEVVLQCALEACKILDNLGLLRQAKHESRAKREKYREEEDFYSSDEDSFLDRTGELEMKRRKRMLEAGKLEEMVETFESLTEKHGEVLAEIDSIGKQLEAAAAHERERKKLEEESQDSLDAYMTSLKSAPVFDKSTVAKLKVKRIGLQKEELRLRKLVEKSKPALVKF